jgi:hypothetical protein
MPVGWLTEARREFHATLLAGILTQNANGIPSNADKDSRISVTLASTILELIGDARTADKLPGQTAGAGFEDASAAFI